ncbi:hypothetical protein NQ317_018678 [Molorchus minor]|uniref:DUF5641 domain-containing protein n=1 Tax=Molorchus minor TaxID=1323400 RepID=A0ABQ9JCI2_9CUCU|nr:hypothetical protein NQ317_018678 [Molorchus minor]
MSDLQCQYSPDIAIWNCRICKSRHNTLLHFNKSSHVISGDPHNSVQQSSVPSKIENVLLSRKVPSANDVRELPGCSNFNSVDEKHPIQGQSELDNGQKDLVHRGTTIFCSTTSNKFNTTILLSTVVVNVLSKNGENHKLRFLLDSCSQSHFLTLDCAKRLKLDILQCHTSVSGIGQSNSLVRGKSNIIFTSRFNPSNRYSIDVLLVDKITDQLPSCTVRADSISHIVDLPLADENFNRPGKINGVIGAELFPLLLGSIKIEGTPCAPIAFETSLGYVVMGAAPIDSNIDEVKMFCIVTEPSLENLVKKFWELEDIPSQTYDSLDDLECEKIYKKDYYREPSGRYVVSLPFKYSPSSLGDSYSIALRRFLVLENKFKRNTEFKLQYSNVMNEYLKEGYMSKVAIDNLGSVENYYIPHHGVFKVDSVSTPLRKALLDHMVQTFWQRWHVEYLNNMQVRQKWNTPSCPVSIGTLVIVRQDNVSPLHWPLGIIEQVFPGKDRVIRVAEVRTKTGIYKRPVVRLCPLPSQ